MARARGARTGLRGAASPPHGVPGQSSLEVALPRPERAYIGRTWMYYDAPLMYAFNTGVGLFKDQRVLIADMAAYQRKTVYAHATGVGEPFADTLSLEAMRTKPRPSIRGPTASGPPSTGSIAKKGACSASALRATCTG